MSVIPTNGGRYLRSLTASSASRVVAANAFLVHQPRLAIYRRKFVVYDNVGKMSAILLPCKSALSDCSRASSLLTAKAEDNSRLSLEVGRYSGIRRGYLLCQATGTSWDRLLPLQIALNDPKRLVQCQSPAKHRLHKQ